MNKEMFKWYRFIGVTILTALLVFLALNLLCYFATELKHKFFPEDHLSSKTITKHIDFLQGLYPDLDPSEIMAIWKETDSQSFIYHP